MKYGELTLGQVEAIVNNLGGMEGVRRFLSGELVIKETEGKFKIWKTIKLGTGFKTVKDFGRALRDGGFKLNARASHILEKSVFTAAAEESEVDLVKVTLDELGFKNGARWDQIHERAKELGFKLCSPEVGPQLRLQYQNQPNGELILVAMEPIFDSDGRPCLLYVACYTSELWLCGSWGDLGNFWYADCQHESLIWYTDRRWVFCRPRK